MSVKGHRVSPLVRIRNALGRLARRVRDGYTIESLVGRGMRLGKNVWIGPHVQIDHSHAWLVSIGDETVIASRAIILAHDASTRRHIGYTKIGRVRIGSRTFIGAGAIILPGVSIGDDVVIGAGSVVTRDVPDGCVAAGNPCRVVGPTSEYMEKNRSQIGKLPTYSAQYTLRGGISREMKQRMISDLESQTGFVD